MKMAAENQTLAMQDLSDTPAERILNINVGVLGHVDSGKTSLVRALSTQLSTAALDKHPQSKERGITLDLGFSSFLTPFPKNLLESQDTETECIDLPLEALQFTLVDCPGHASLIRTVIGGAQIIDMLLLVVDVTKGIQTQTAECLVIGEITTNNLIVALNKVDLLPEGEKQRRIEAVEAKIRKALKDTKFSDVSIIPVAANVGGGDKLGGPSEGESHRGKNGQHVRHLQGQLGGQNASAERPATLQGVFSTTVPQTASSNLAGARESVKTGAVNLDRLVCLLQEKAPLDRLVREWLLSAEESLPPMLSAALNALSESSESQEGTSRLIKQPFYFPVDHCFQIKGKGTVLTGTVLSGRIKVGDTIELPLLGVEKKVKSMQMFHKPVREVRKGDRVALCVVGLSAKLIERGVAATPGSVSRITHAIAYVQRVRYFRGRCQTGMKFHLTVGHTTVMAQVTFFREEAIPAMDKPQTRANGARVPANRPEAAVLHVVAADEVSGAQTPIAGDPPSSAERTPTTCQTSAHKRVFDWSKSYELSEELAEGGAGTQGPSGTPTSAKSASRTDAASSWALLQFEAPVLCPSNAILIGSRLDMEVNTKACRIAFHGTVVESVGPGQGGSGGSSSAVSEDKQNPASGSVGAKKTATAADASQAVHSLQDLKIFKRKQRIGLVEKTREDSRTSEGKYKQVIACDLFHKESNISHFFGMKLVTKNGEIGEIQSTFGTGGSFKVGFEGGGARLRRGDKLFFNFRKYIFDKKVKMTQTPGDLIAPYEDESPTGSKSSSITPGGSSSKNCSGSSYNSNNNSSSRRSGRNKEAKVSAQIPPTGRNGQHAVLRTHHNQRVGEVSSGVVDDGGVAPVSEGAASLQLGEAATLETSTRERKKAREGLVDKLKSETLSNGNHTMLIAQGLFSADEDIASYFGLTVETMNGEKGSVSGPFGKLGKVKVTFQGAGTSAKPGDRLFILDDKQG